MSTAPADTRSDFTPLSQPEPGLTRETLIARAEAMIPMLREQQEEADTRGYFSNMMLDEFRAAGFYRMLQPKMFGGYEVDSETFFEVVYRIATGHPSSGWCFALSATHVSVLASHFPLETQIELIGPEGEFRSPHRLVPGGTAKRVNGGYQIDGIWRFSSGSPVATHFIGNTLYAEDGALRNLMFVLPASRYTVLDDWGGDAALGVQGSGSNSVKIENQFVPDRWVVDADVTFGTGIDYSVGTVGTQIHGNPRYLGVFGAIYHICFSAIFAGAARAAVEEFREIMPRTRANGHFQPMSEDPDALRALGEAASLADASESIFRDVARQNDELYRRWEKDRTPILPGEIARLWALAHQGAALGTQAVQLVWQSSGSGMARKGTRIQRYLRDCEMYLIHLSSQPWVDRYRARTEFDPSAGLFG
jgi:3-hydroxy-9,10-secoandrosta-1,3,5(10)-triene-9,17-dione monooxygenase